MHPEVVEKAEKEERELKEAEARLREFGNTFNEFETSDIRILLREIDLLRNYNKVLIELLDKK